MLKQLENQGIHPSSCYYYSILNSFKIILCIKSLFQSGNNHHYLFQIYFLLFFHLYFLSDFLYPYFSSESIFKQTIQLNLNDQGLQKLKLLL